MSSRIARLSIVTAAWSTPLPLDVVQVGISRGPPRRRKGYRMVRELAPGDWYRSVNEAEFILRYNALLSETDPRVMFEKLVRIADGAPTAALLCFERPLTDDGWCHRSLTAQWLETSLGIRVPEWGFEHLVADQHPMLPRSLSAAQ